MEFSPQPLTPRLATWALLTWLIGGGLMVWLDGQVDLANLAMILVLTSALASFWLPGWASISAGAFSVAAFNWAFVPPRHAFAVDLRQDAVLLVALLLVNGIISALMASQRRLARHAQMLAEREVRLRQWGDTLRDAVDPAAHSSALHDLLESVAGVPVALRVLNRANALEDQSESAVSVGETSVDEQIGLDLCIREGRALGPGSGRYEEQSDAYLPLRGRGVALGAAVLRGLGDQPGGVERLAHAQALCDQMGVALQRHITAREERVAREQAQAQGVRNTLLAAISHDYRTPLATIMSAASSIEQQDQRLSMEQRRKLAAGIVEEAERLSRLTDNTLQLARLDAAGVSLRCDWESAEEIVGAVLRRVRRRDPSRRIRARLEPALPLLWCDAILLSQLLENLIDNALKYSPEEAPVEILVRRLGADVVLAVRDRGSGIAPSWRGRVFDVFQRGTEAHAGPDSAPLPAGTGVGLAVCRAIARAHGGEMRMRARAHGGSSFECALPVREVPRVAEAAATP